MCQADKEKRLQKRLKERQEEEARHAKYKQARIDLEMQRLEERRQ